MPVRELLARTSAGELAEWAALFKLEAAEREQAAKTNGRAHR